MEKVVPGFILKLWRMINDPRTNDLICWNDNGQSFIISDPIKFSSQLSKYFKHNNLSSFIRQLNMYGFKKVATIDNDDLHFYHPDFLRNHQDRLELIKRKLPQKIESIDMKAVVRNLTDIETKQQDVTKVLADMKRENEMLWAELHDLRQKHQQQQLYITSLMKLVFSAMDQQKQGFKPTLQVHRAQPLMIENIEQAPYSTVIETTAATTTVPTVTNATTTATNIMSPTEINAMTQQLMQEAVNTQCAPATTTAVQTIPTVQQTTPPTPMDINMTEQLSNHNQVQILSSKIEDQSDQIDDLVPYFDDYGENPMEDLFAN